ncbi:prenyltransferase [Microbacterium amylolyticum]|uniref:4-hydroxybenzoate polyprenyltransferase n=1 Tax=Microbacterium amylolyticum TaxID=936337 RepID=A0ABS4ZF12_9MICO|nr:prenyltransferase [Microbacterium amylolyticum]MBP2435869.1 4-hydroxybenzoate polyprenyltransferase [Microbacterium amylolyticum]
MIRDLVAASRPLSWINTAYPFAAAYLLAGGIVDPLFIVGVVFFLVPYNLAMYGINDVFDYASDIANPRKGGVEGALLAPAKHRMVLVASGVSCAPFIVALGVLAPPLALIPLAIAMFAVVAYSAPPFRAKEIPLVDSITSSTHFVAPAVYGVAAAGGDFSLTVVAALAAFFAWGIASHAFGAVQDVLPDREAGISSIATRFGAARTVRFAILMWLAAAAFLVFAGPPAAWAAFLVVPYVCAAAPFFRISDADSARANRGWRLFLGINFVCGFLLTLLLIVVAIGAI